MDWLHIHDILVAFQIELGQKSLLCQEGGKFLNNFKIVQNYV